MMPIRKIEKPHIENLNQKFVYIFLAFCRMDPSSKVLLSQGNLCNLKPYK